MIEYEFFPEKCVGCPFKSACDYHIKDIDVQERLWGGIGEAMMGDEIKERMSSHFGEEASEDAVTDFRRDVGKTLNEFDKKRNTTKKAALKRAAVCTEGPIVIVTGDEAVNWRIVNRRCQSPQKPLETPHPWVADVGGLFLQGGELYEPTRGVIAGILLNKKK